MPGQRKFFPLTGHERDYRYTVDMKPIVITSVSSFVLGIALEIAGFLSAGVALARWRPDPQDLIPIPPFDDLVPSVVLATAGGTFVTIGVIGGLLALHAYALTSTMERLAPVSPA